MKSIEKPSFPKIADCDNLLLLIIAAATLVIVFNSCYLLYMGRFTHTRIIDLTGGVMALGSGIIVHRRKRSLAGEVDRHARKHEDLHRVNSELEAMVAERTALLQNTNTFLEAIVQESPLAVVVLGLDWNVRVWSPAAERMFGWSSSEVCGGPVPFIFPERHEEWEGTLMHRMHWGKKTFYDEQRPRKDGSVIDLSTWTASLHGESGGAFAYLLIYADNRERKRAEEALKKSEECFALFLDNLPGVAFMKETDGRYTHVNRGCRQLYRRFGIENVLGKTDQEMWPPEVAERYLQNDREVLRTMKAVQVIEPAFSDDSTAHFLINKFPIEDHTGKTILGGIGIDITELKNTEKALAELQSRQEAIIENIPDVVWLKQLDGRYITVNKAFERVMGLSRTEVEGKTDRELWPEEQATHFAASDREVVASNSQYGIEEHVQVRGGDWRWFESLKKPLCNEEGEVIGTTGVARDITERKRGEEKLHLFQEQLSALAAELSLAEERERRRISSELHDQIGQSLALTKIKLNALIATSADGEQAGLIGELQEALDHCIMEVRSLTSQISPPLLYEIGFEPALEWLCEWMGDNYGLRVELHREGPSVVLSDETRGALFRIVRELLINCGKHAGSASATVSCRRFSDRLEITVVDSGAGFDTTALELREHSGFGLFSIRQRIRYMGGECRIESAPGRGTMVELKVPLSSEAADDRC